MSEDQIITSGQDPAAEAVFDSNLKLRFGEIPAFNDRMWLRGRLLRSNAADREQGWFSRWFRRRSKDDVPQMGSLETRVGGKVATSEVALTPEGHFESRLQVNLPKTHRGWRVARNKLTVAKLEVESCGIVLHSPETTSKVLVVVLPVDWTNESKAIEKVAQSDKGEQLGQMLQQVVRQSKVGKAVYYLGCCSPYEEGQQQEVALALTALGWPQGTIVLLPAKTNQAMEQFTHGVNSFRWLFAGTELVLVSLQPDLGPLFETAVIPEEGHAPVTKLITNPEELREKLTAGEAENNGFKHRKIRPTRSNRLTRFPVVFCHGMLALSQLRMQVPERLNSFAALDPFLKQRGFQVLFPEVAPTGKVVERAAQLREQILRWTDEPVNLIAHSMGGLDARYMIAHLDMAKRVQTLTTVSTPHHGTFIAEWFIKNYRHRVPLLLALEALGANFDGFRDCCRGACQEFNANTPNASEVQYFSYGGDVPQLRLSPMLRRAWTILTPVEGPNDGMVSLESAKWGEFLGSIQADHFAQLPDAIHIHPAEKFDALSFYLGIVDDLAWRGF